MSGKDVKLINKARILIKKRLRNNSLVTDIVNLVKDNEFIIKDDSIYINREVNGRKVSYTYTVLDDMIYFKREEDKKFRCKIFKLLDNGNYFVYEYTKKQKEDEIAEYHNLCGYDDFNDEITRINLKSFNVDGNHIFSKTKYEKNGNRIYKTINYNGVEKKYFAHFNGEFNKMLGENVSNLNWYLVRENKKA